MGPFKYIFWVALIYRVFLKIKKSLSYWQDRDVKCEKPSIVLGNMAPLILKKTSLWDMFKKWYKMFPGEKYVGVYVFFKPQLVIRNLDVIKRIAINDFEYFIDLTKQSLRPNLASSKGQNWKNLRHTVSPTFSNSRIKYIMPLISECAKQLEEHLLILEKGDDFDVLDVAGRYANDSMLNAIFSYKINSFEDKNNSIYSTVKNCRQYQALEYSLTSMPIIVQFTKILRSIYKFQKKFIALCQSCLRSKITSPSLFPDLTQMMIEEFEGRLKKETDCQFDIGFSVVNESLEHFHDATKTKLSNRILNSHLMELFFKGFDLTSNLICFMSCELVNDLSVQIKLQKELDTILEETNGRITYESLAKMKYLDAVVSESLRKWPPYPVLKRLCVKDYDLEPQENEELGLVLEKDTTVLIPIVGLHYDPEYFPNPEKFDPERFNDKNKSNIKPYSFLPFGIGARNCIGSRIALVQIKLFFIHVLSKFSFVASEKTERQLEMSVNSFAHLPDCGFWLKLVKRDKNFKQ